MFYVSDLLNSVQVSYNIFNYILNSGWKFFVKFADTQVTIEEAADILEILGKPNTSLLNTKTALQLLHAQISCSQITSFCEQLDSVLGGGISLGTLSEISGIAGVGKTQLW